MARLFTEANSEFLSQASAIVAGAPATYACWFFVVDATEHGLISVGDASEATHHQTLNIDYISASTVNAESRGGGDSKLASSTANITLNQWEHACGIWAATNDRRAFLNGGNKGTETSTVTPSGLDRSAIGRFDDGSPDKYMDGRIAEAAIWNVALADEEVAALAAGVSPLRIQPASLQAYWPLLALTGDAPDYSGNAKILSDNNTVTVADHAPVQPPFGFDLGWQGAFAAAAAASIAILRRRYEGY